MNGKYAFFTRPMDDFIDTGSGGGIGFGTCDDITHPVIDEEIITSPPALPHHHRGEKRRGRHPHPHRKRLAAHRPRRAQHRRGLRYVIYVFVTDLAEPWKVIAEPSGYLALSQS